MAAKRATLLSSLPLFLILILFSLFLSHLQLLTATDSHFEGFEADEEEEDSSLIPDSLPRSPPLTQSHLEPDPIPDPAPSDQNPDPNQPSDLPPPPTTTKPSSTNFEYWDEDEFEGLPIEQPPPQEEETSKSTEQQQQGTVSDPKASESPKTSSVNTGPKYYTIEIVCGSFLIVFLINYFTGKRENENIALSWAGKFAVKDSIFDKNFSLLGISEGDDSPLLLKEGQNVFKFYASGRRYCQGLLATMELKSRHDLIARIYNMVVPCKDEITFEVYMNDDAMDHVIFALAKKKAAKTMQKEVRDLQRFASVVSPPNGRKWVADELSVISESKEVACDLITDTVLDQVFGEKAFEKYGKGFISMHFSDQHLGTTKKMLLFKFALPKVEDMGDMTNLVALVTYYIDLIGRYKLSSQARSKTDAIRAKIAQEEYKEHQNARQEALQRKKAERRKLMEEAEAKLSAEAIRKKEAKRQAKKSMPRVKMTRGH